MSFAPFLAGRLKGNAHGAVNSEDSSQELQRSRSSSREYYKYNTSSDIAVLKEDDFAALFSEIKNIVL